MQRFLTKLSAAVATTLVGGTPSNAADFFDLFERCAQIASVEHFGITPPASRIYCNEPYADAIHQAIVKSGRKEEQITEGGVSITRVSFFKLDAGGIVRCNKTAWIRQCEIYIRDSRSAVEALLQKLKNREASLSDLTSDPDIKKLFGPMRPKLTETALLPHLKACVAEAHVAIIAFDDPQMGITCNGRAAHTLATSVLDTLPAEAMSVEKTWSSNTYAFGEIDPTASKCITAWRQSEAMCFFKFPSMQADELGEFLKGLQAGQECLYALPIGVAVRNALWSAAQTPSEPAAATSTEAEIEFWNSVKDSRSADEIQAYINAYPNGRFADLARLRMKRVQDSAP